jgi:hypothetical protein
MRGGGNHAATAMFEMAVDYLSQPEENYPLVI